MQTPDSSSVDKMQLSIYRQRLEAQKNILSALTEILIKYFKKYNEFPNVKEDQAIFSFITSRPELKKSFDKLDLNRDQTLEIFRQAKNNAEKNISEQQGN